MNTSKVKKIIVVSLIGLCMLAWVCIKLVFPRFNHTNTDAFITADNNSSDSTNNEQTTVDFDYMQELYNPKNASVKNKHTKTGGTIYLLDCDVKDVTATKKVSKEEEKAILDPKVTISNGIITNDYRVVKIDIVFKNNREVDAELFPNTNKIEYTDSPGNGVEAFMMQPYEYPPEAAKHFYCNLSPGEEKQIELYYTVKDEDVENANHKTELVFNPNGLDEQYFSGTEEDAVNYFIHVDISDKVKNLED